ncbi:hypothetical protein HDU84_003903 [Entophlyctis sp. JEL0112]|nr:hypothetical protein HDU84_003903 [Entophlyctis sp. JEL0112]
MLFSLFVCALCAPVVATGLAVRMLRRVPWLRVLSAVARTAFTIIATAARRRLPRRPLSPAAASATVPAPQRPLDVDNPNFSNALLPRASLSSSSVSSGDSLAELLPPPRRRRHHRRTLGETSACLLTPPLLRDSDRASASAPNLRVRGLRIRQAFQGNEWEGEGEGDDADEDDDQSEEDCDDF